MINHGLYHLAPKFAQLEVSQETKKKRAFKSAKMSSITESPPACQLNNLSSINQRPGAHITVEFENIKSAYPTTLQHILEKAGDRAVMQAPSSKETRKTLWLKAKPWLNHTM